MKGIVLLVVVVVTCHANGLRAQLFSDSDKFDGFFFYKGEDFYKMCTSADAQTQRACGAYVCGAVDAWSASYVLDGKKVYPFCVPTDTTCGRLTSAVTKFLADNPGERAAAAAGAIGYALAKTFPCPGNPR